MSNIYDDITFCMECIRTGICATGSTPEGFDIQELLMKAVVEFNKQQEGKSNE